MKGLRLFTKPLRPQGSSPQNIPAKAGYSYAKVKLADKPGSVGLIAKADSHSSRRMITHALKQPTRWQREPRLITLR